MYSDVRSVRHERTILGRVRYNRVVWTLLLATNDLPSRDLSKSLFGMNEEPSPLSERLAGNFGFGKYHLNVFAHHCRTGPRRMTLKESLLEARSSHVPHESAQLLLFLTLGSCVNVAHLHFRMAHTGTPKNTRGNRLEPLYQHDKESQR